MTKRNGTCLDAVADAENLHRAFHRAATGKADRREVMAFRSRHDEEISSLRRDILAETVEVGRFHSFRIRDPKPRTIHAACFRERVLHHAIVNRVGGALDRCLVDDCFACRTGKGSHAAILRVQHHLRRFPRYARIDIQRYFDSIDHNILKCTMRRRLKGPGLLRLLDRIIDSYSTKTGKGLPIGSLTSQYFANLYLSDLDRFLLEKLGVCGMVRYMDDIVWWDKDRAKLMAVLEEVREYLAADRSLSLNPSWEINKSSHGLTFCGVRVQRGARLLTRRARRRYSAERMSWEEAFEGGRINELELMRRFASVWATTRHCDAAGWRAGELRRNPATEVEEYG